MKSTLIYALAIVKFIQVTAHTVHMHNSCHNTCTQQLQLQLQLQVQLQVHACRYSYAKERSLHVLHLEEPLLAVDAHLEKAHAFHFLFGEDLDRVADIHRCTIESACRIVRRGFVAKPRFSHHLLDRVDGLCWCQRLCDGGGTGSSGVRDGARRARLLRCWFLCWFLQAEPAVRVSKRAQGVRGFAAEAHLCFQRMREMVVAFEIL